MVPIAVEEPTVRMTFGVNKSPLAGREGKFLTTRMIRDRLMKELDRNVALRVDETASSDVYEVCIFALSTNMPGIADIRCRILSTALFSSAGTPRHACCLGASTILADSETPLTQIRLHSSALILCGKYFGAYEASWYVKLKLSAPQLLG